MRFTEVIQVGRPPAIVHAYVSDLKNLPRWYPAIVAVRQTSSGPVGPGTTYAVIRLLLGFEAAVSYRIVDYKPSRRTVLVGWAPHASTEDTLEIEPAPNDGSQLTWTTETRLAGLRRLLEPLLMLAVYYAQRAAWRRLAYELEQLPRLPERPDAERSVNGGGRTSPERGNRQDRVERTSEDSFPASDPPAWTPARV